MKKLTTGLSGKNFSYLIAAIDEAAIVAVTDKKGMITYVNKKFCAISEYAEEELIGQTHSLINSRFHPKSFFKEMWETITQGKTWEGEIRNRSKGGRYYWVNTTIVPFMDQDGNPEQFIAVRYEITEKKMAEEQLKIYTKKLELSNQELQDFASVAAHDLQEPLRKIQSFADRAKIKAKDAIPDEALDYLNRVQTSAGRMQVLINDLLTYSRITTQAKPFTQISLDQVIKNACSDLEIRLEQTGGKIYFEHLPNIEADAVQIHQLFLNLLNNALKFQKPETTPAIYITAEIDTNIKGFTGPVCHIYVKDNGIGFDEKYLDRIFTIFQRLHGRHEYEGTGIGLAVCRKIVDRHGGQLTAQSSPGQGATFKITLPLTHSEKIL
jgi:two-component system, LuxR family, sensor kinase FixL